MRGYETQWDAGSRVGDGDNKPLGVDIIDQFFAQPKAILLGAAMLFGIGLIPGFPKAQVLGLAAAVALVGLSLFVRLRARKPAGDGTAKKPGEDFTMVTPLMVEVDAGIRDALAYGQLAGAVEEVRRTLCRDLGIPFPSVSLSLDESLSEGRCRILVNEVPVSEGRLLREHVFALESAERLRAAGIPFRGGDPLLDDFETCWVEESRVRTLDENGIRHFSLQEVLCRHVSKVMRRHADEFLTLQETRELLGRLELAAPELPKEVQRVLPLQKITDVLRRLVQEGISVRDLKCIAQALVEWGVREKDPVLLVEHVRAALGRYIAHRFSGGRDGVLSAYLLDAALEDRIRHSMRQTPAGGCLEMDPAEMRRILDSVGEAVGDLRRTRQKPVLLVPVDIRRAVRTMIETDYRELPVLSHQELPRDVSVRTLGRIRA